MRIFLNRRILVALLLLVGIVSPFYADTDPQPESTPTPNKVALAKSGVSLAELLPSIDSNTWVSVSGTELKRILEPEAFVKPIKGIIGPRGIIDAWNGAVWNEKLQRLDIINAGGHADYGGNEYSAFNLESLSWEKIHGPSDLTGYDSSTGMTPDGKPASRHNYQMQVFVPSLNKTLSFGGSLFSSAGKGDKLRWAISPEGEYKLLRTSKKWGSLGGAALYDPITEDVFYVKRNSVYRFDTDLSSNTGAELTALSHEGDDNWGASAALDHTRRMIYVFGHSASWSYNIATGERLDVVPTGDFSPIMHPGVGMLYVESLDRYVLYSGGNKLYFVHPETYHISPMTVAGATPRRNFKGVYGRFIYSKRFNTFALVTGYDENVYIMKMGALPPISKNMGELRTDNPQTLITAANDYSEVKIPAGIYRQGMYVKKPIVLNMDGASLWAVYRGKAGIVVKDVTGPVVIKNFTFNGIVSGASGSNKSAIRAGAKGHLTIEDSDISNSAMGITTDNKGGTLIINRTYLHDIGREKSGAQLSHVIYAGNIDRVELRNSRIEQSNNKGHLFKSRAPESLIENTIINGKTSRHSRVIDLSCGGNLTISNTVLIQSPRSDNNDIIGLAREGHKSRNCTNDRPPIVTMTNVTVKAGRPDAVLFSTRRQAHPPVTLIDGGGNTFEGVAEPAWSK